MKPRLLDLFCGEGGASMGYHMAGFDVVGVDLKPQPRYPFAFVQGDALCPPVELERFDAIHASPPCQAYSRSRFWWNTPKDHPDLLPETRALLERAGRPWVIENVPGAPMRADVIVCGSMFGLRVRRHRLFEMSPAPDLALVPPCDHSIPAIRVYGHCGVHNRPDRWGNGSTIAHWRASMGIRWMGVYGLSQAIPPAYTEMIGRLLLRAINARTDAA